jgi:tryptophan synthase alpha chain
VTRQRTALEARLRALRARGGKAFVPYLMLGDPDLATSLAFARALCAAGADALELGIPFSDPLADGPVIQAAGQRALAAGFRVEQAFAAAARLHAETDVPLLFMVYDNLVLQRPDFVGAAAAAGVAGLLVPDLPREESGELAARCRAAGIDLVPFVAPTSTDERIAPARARRSRSAWRRWPRASGPPRTCRCWSASGSAARGRRRRPRPWPTA